MIPEIRRRPLVRPLFIWISGILIAAFWWTDWLSAVLLLIPLLFLLISVLSFSREATFHYGSRWIWGFLFSCLLFFLSVQFTGYRINKTEKMEPGNWMITYAAGLQQRCVEKLDRLDLTQEEKAVLSTMTVGYRQQLPRKVRQQFSAIGVAHLLAVSGFHVGIVAGFVSFFLSFMGNGTRERWLRYSLIIVTVLLYVFLTGCAASAVRAAFMTVLYFTGRLFRRNTDRYNTLAAAAFCMLVYDPLYLFDIGFQLSFMAVFFIFRLQPGFEKYIPVRNPLIRIPWNWVTLSLSAQAGVFLLCLYYFGNLPLVFLWVNLPLIALVTLLIPAVFVWILCPESFTIPFLQPFIKSLTHLMMKITGWFASFPYASWEIKISFFWVITGYIFILGGFALSRKQKI